jgi:exopolysaccharide biosynthesis predicted pyruvyltransferase EpsI
MIYGGGGNLHEKYSNARTFIECNHARAKKFVILPHTIKGHKKLLSKLGNNVDIFCRELKSYKLVKKNVSGPNVYLSDDLAFRIDAKGVLERHSPSEIDLLKRIGYDVCSSALRRIGVRGRNCHDLRMSGRLGTVAFYKLVGSIITKKSSKLYAYRTDVEKTEQNRPVENVDVSRIFECGVAPQSQALQATVLTLAYLNHFDRIVTNRLHIGILAGLLNKSVDLYPNNYFKNKEVYRLSMKKELPNVKWYGR